MGLIFNPEKSKVIHFNNRTRPLDISIDNRNIPNVNTIKYLGRTISANNSAMNHIKNTMNNIKKTCGFYKILNNRNRGATPQRALQIYRAFIRPRIEYAVATFSNLGKNAVNTIKTNINTYLRQGLGLIRSTPNHILYHMANELPPEYRFKLATHSVRF